MLSAVGGLGSVPVVESEKCIAEKTKVRFLWGNERERRSKAERSCYCPEMPPVGKCGWWERVEVWIACISSGGQLWRPELKSFGSYDWRAPPRNASQTSSTVMLAPGARVREGHWCLLSWQIVIFTPFLKNFLSKTNLTHVAWKADMVCFSSSIRNPERRVIQMGSLRTSQGVPGVGIKPHGAGLPHWVPTWKEERSLHRGVAQWQKAGEGLMLPPGRREQVRSRVGNAAEHRWVINIFLSEQWNSMVERWPQLCDNLRRGTTSKVP